MESKSFDFLARVVGPSHHKERVDELRKKVGCSPSKYLQGIPFDCQIETEIRTMLASHALRDSVITFLMENFNHPDQQISSLCQYLSYELSWSGDLRVFTLMNEKLVKTKSPVLSDSRVVAEVENLEELIKAISSHTYPQYFNHLCLTSELFYLDVSRFPNLFAVARVLEKGDNAMDKIESQLSGRFPILCLEISGMNKNTVVELVKLHREAMAQNRVSTVRRMPSVPGI
jgi:hypothetical protein